ncbi:MAG: EAL domain-containing protein [Synechococcus sp.]|nr:EAL domain-containing protein [Synechococcus sp.]
MTVGNDPGPLELLAAEPDSLARAELELVSDAVLVLEAVGGRVLEANPAARNLDAVALRAHLPSLAQLRRHPQGSVDIPAHGPMQVPRRLRYRLLVQPDPGSANGAGGRSTPREILVLAVHAMADASQESLQRLNFLLNEAERQSHIGAWEIDHSRGELLCSREARRLCGLEESSDDPLQLEDLLEKLSEVEQLRLLEAYRASLETGEPLRVQYQIAQESGQVRTVLQRGLTAYAPNGEPLTTIGTLQDVSELHDLQQQLESAAYVDPLTGLPNKAATLQHLQSLLQGRPYNESLTLINLDLDNFQSINDSFGPEAANRLLTTTGQVLRAQLQASDWVARLGSDEFLVIRSEGVGSVGDGVALGQQLQQLVSSTEQLQHLLPVQASACLGVSSAPEHGTEPSLLLQAANTALMEAKRRGKNQLCVYSTTLSQRIRERLELESQLTHAVERRQLRLVYQPQVDGQGQLIGAEALLRWCNSAGTNVPPDVFIPLAEQSGMIHTIGALVLEEACRQLREWEDQGLVLPLLAVNVSGSQLQPQHPPLPDAMLAVAERHGIPPERIELEITETALIEHPQQARKQLKELGERGFRLAIDDFGTGFSSLETLHALPLDKLKIDRCFVNDLEHDLTDQVIVRATLSMARELGLETLAEGVESNQQWHMLQDLGCHYFQGYFFDRPLPPEAFLERLRQSQPNE